MSTKEKQLNTGYKMTDEDLKKVRELENGYEAWHGRKVVDETTPLLYLTGTISKQLNSEGCAGSLLGYAVNLIQNTPDEAILILERAGFHVKALPSVF